jgi:glycosyltransferase involved in cell wall biosynthesis
MIWLINPYGPIPGEGWRDYSFTMMAGALTAEGHEVVWWTSSFSHHFKKHRSSGWEDRPINERFTIRLVPTPGYKKNIGLGRIVRDWVFSYRTYKKGKALEKPICIIYYESPLSLGYAGLKLAQYHDCPVIYHQMDLWPELIEQAFPRWARPLAKLAFFPVYRSRKYVYSKLDAAVALARHYLDVMLQAAPALKGRPNAVIYNGVDVKQFRAMMLESSGHESWIPEKSSDEYWAVFAGSLGPSYDIDTLLKAAEELGGLELKLSIIIAGDGPLRPLVELFLLKHPKARVKYLGKLDPTRLGALYKRCDIGLCAYSSRSNVEMPDKLYDYTAAGLPIINSLTGEARDVILDRKIGLQYLPGDPDSLLNALRIMTNDGCLRMEMAANSFKIGGEFDQHVQYMKICDILRQIIPDSMHKPQVQATWHQAP